MNKMKKSVLSLLLTLMMAMMLAACGTETETSEGTGQAAQQEAGQAADQGSETNNDSEEASSKTEYPLTLTDATGESFTFEQAPAKIVSVSPAETESLFAIGLEEQIVGVSDFDDYPEAAASKPKMGSLYEPNAEAIIAAEPDIVFTGISMDEAAVQKLRDLGIVIFKTDPKTIDDVMKNIEVYGQITDRQAEAAEVVDQMKADIQEVSDKVAALSDEEKKQVYVEFSPGWTVGKGEFMDEVITLAGGVNVAGDTEGWNEISEEKIIQANPDVILYASDVIDDNNQTLDQIITARDGWNEITAIKEDAVISIDANLLSRPGPRVTEGLKVVAEAIYPDLFQ
ncbi:ABC transporter substrate-binding protein [Paenibacillus shunpengii]|uniref:ABC transporter substrate-binding protein n=1 Tax=Paenibacillus shunpengii TaxID=2054424 RepID=A0ABW5SIH9_9BACL|nr:ABC transporter substrate-binding protein [Paenibacillus sp. PDC88]SDW39157.1 iron complex transport system substrate-binding protein [Paenibacillus sp. PDC88]